MDVVTDFFRCISLCHDCISVNDEKASLNLAYNGPSVDEVCLLNMTKDTQKGYFLDRDSSSIRIMINGEEESYDLLKTFQFTSERKAMSVVVKHPTEEGKVICFVKGADSSIFPLLKGNSGKNDVKDGDVLNGSINAEDNYAAAYIKKVDKNVETFASKGLRTLLFAMKVIEIDEEGIENLEIPDVESDLNLLAATAVEDLLQENVKECIVDFRAAGINVWMLTGDKGLTAKEIGVSCGLIPSMVGSSSTDD
jgi:magnesium-transporting ATPase (P-type)